MDTTRPQTKRRARSHSSRVVVLLVTLAVVLSAVGPFVGPVAAQDDSQNFVYVIEGSTIKKIDPVTDTTNGSVSYTNDFLDVEYHRGYIFASALNDGVVLRYNATDMNNQQSLSIASSSNNDNTFGLDASGEYVYATDAQGDVHKIQYDTFSSVNSFNPNEGVTSRVSVADDGKRLAIGSDKAITIVDVSSMSRIANRSTSDVRKNGIAFSPDQQSWYVSDNNGLIEKISYDGNLENSTTLSGITYEGSVSPTTGKVFWGDRTGTVYKFNADLTQVDSRQAWNGNVSGDETIYDADAANTGDVYIVLRKDQRTIKLDQSDLSSKSDYSTGDRHIGLGRGLSISGYDISGTVRNTNTNPIEGVTVSTNETATATTDGSGFYTLVVSNGTYEVTAEKDGYTSETKTITVSGGSVTQDFELTELNETLELDVDRFMKHGSRQSYTVLNTNETTGDTSDVTDSATVTSDDATVITVLSVTNQLEATSDESVAQEVQITAEYDNKTTTENVTVANASIQNLDILPPWTKFDAVLTSRLDGDGVGDSQNDTTLILLVAAFAGAVFRATGSTYLGLTAFESIVILGWVLGKTGNGVLLVSLTAVGFVALNLAANIDYGVSRT